MPAVANNKKTCRFYVNFYKLDSFTQLLHSFMHSLIDRLLVDTERNQKQQIVIYYLLLSSQKSIRHQLRTTLLHFTLILLPSLLVSAH